jgi:ABC-2 type transport system ATP-binding protein
MQEVESICDRIVVINNGKIVADQNLEGKINVKDSPKEQILLVEFDQELKINALKKSFPKTKIDQKDRFWLFSYTGKDDLRKIISKYAQKHNILILEMKAHNDKLEDLFKKLTN